MKVSMEVGQKNPKPRVQQFGTSILQVGTMQWHQVLAFDNLHCETLLSRDCNFKYIFKMIFSQSLKVVSPYVW